MLFAITDQAIQREDTRRDKIMRFEQVEILAQSATVGDQVPDSKAYVVVDANVHVFSSVLPLLDESSCQTATPSVHDRTTLFAFH